MPDKPEMLHLHCPNADCGALLLIRAAAEPGDYTCKCGVTQLRYHVQHTTLPSGRVETHRWLQERKS